MQSVSSRIWTRVAVSISYDDNDYTTGTSLWSKVGDRSRGWPEGFFFDSYNIKVLEWALLLSLDCSTLPLIRTL